MTNIVRAIFIAAAAMLAQGFSFDARAAELKAAVQTCTTPDCGATQLGGRTNKSDRCCGFDNLALPWVTQVYANKNECLWLHVTQQDTDTELVAIAPATQRAWRNDKSNLPACKTCPLLKIITGPTEAGWFLVQVNSHKGDPIDAEFNLQYARYKKSNPNCNSPTAPLPPP